jgi:hypothetical protein
MADDLFLRRKWTFRAHGRQVVFVKRPNEQAAHVVMKALVWALYLPEYPDLRVEIPFKDRYQPDVLSLDAQGKPRFWGEAGEVSATKIRSLCKRHRETHFAIAKWDSRLDLHAAVIQQALSVVRRTAPFDLISVPDDSASRFIDDHGQIQIAHDDLHWIRFGADGGMQEHRPTPPGSSGW